jgi:hypothetical protein
MLLSETMVKRSSQSASAGWLRLLGKVRSASANSIELKAAFLGLRDTQVRGCSER